MWKPSSVDRRLWLPLHPTACESCSACLFVLPGSLSSAQSTAERWEAKCWCSSFDRSLKASSCSLWLLSCAVIIVVCNDVLRHCMFPGCDLRNERHYFWNSFSIYYVCKHPKVTIWLLSVKHNLYNWTLK